MFGDASRLVLDLPPLRRRKALGGGAVALTALGLSACGGNAGGANAVQKELEKLSLRLSWIKNVEFAGFFVAQERGFYKDEGIALTVNGTAQNLPEIQAVATRADVIGLSGSTSLLKARAQGIPVKAFGALFQKGPGCYIWLEKSGIKSIKDFKGKRLGGLQSARPSTNLILSMHGLKPEDVTFVPIGFDVTPLLTGQVDILAGIVTNQVVVLEQQGEKVGYQSYNDLGFVSYWNTPFALEETIKNRKDILAAWMRASARGWVEAIKAPDQTAKLIVEGYGEGLDLKNQTIEMQREIPFIQTDFTKQKGLFWMEAPVWQKAHDSLRQIPGELEQAVKIEDVMTLEILQKVGKIGG